MRYLIAVVLYAFLAGPAGVYAQTKPDAASKPPAQAAAETESATKGVKPDQTTPAPLKTTAQTGAKIQLEIIGKNKGSEPGDFRFELGETLKIKATGDLNKIKEELAKSATNRALVLYFDGVRMDRLPSSAVQVLPENEVHLFFHLVRDANNDDNRKAWDSLLTKKGSYVMTIEPALAVGNALPDTVRSAQPFQFFIGSGWTVFVLLAASLLILFVTFRLVLTRTNMLRDANSGHYSLGKSQMAFWGLLVALAFIAVWIITGTMERIPPQALTLLGISGATGLSAILIGDSKISEMQKKLKTLQQEERELAKELTANPATFPQTSKDRLSTVATEIVALSSQLQAGQSKGFWRDICSDSNGLSFHRLQVVIWTVILGLVFVRSVAQVMSMPEFPETLLLLMGISNATYLGFKIPEK